MATADQIDDHGQGAGWSYVVVPFKVWRRPQLQRTAQELHMQRNKPARLCAIGIALLPFISTIVCAQQPATPLADVPQTVKSSATITAAGKFQQVLAPSATERQALTINNFNADSCWLFIGSGHATKENSTELVARGSYVRYWPFVPSDAIQATCATSSDTLDINTR